jgi:hypothetical protein
MSSNDVATSMHVMALAGGTVADLSASLVRLDDTLEQARRDIFGPLATTSRSGGSSGGGGGRGTIAIGGGLRAAPQPRPDPVTGGRSDPLRAGDERDRSDPLRIGEPRRPGRAVQVDPWLTPA